MEKQRMRAAVAGVTLVLVATGPGRVDTSSSRYLGGPAELVTAPNGAIVRFLSRPAPVEGKHEVTPKEQSTNDEGRQR